MRVVWHILLMCIGFISTIYTFEVKVLLYKTNNLENNPFTLQSKFGFVLSKHPIFSFGMSCKDPCTITKSSQGFVINGKQLSHQPYYITSKLSPSHQEYVKNYIVNWLDQHQQDLTDRSETLHIFFDNLVDKKNVGNSSSYEDLTHYVHDSISLFLKDFVEQLGDHSVVSVETLQDYAQQFIDYRIKNSFLDQLADKHLAKKDRKLLQQNTQYRYDFFKKHVYHVIQHLLQEYVIALPRNILSQFLQEEVGSISFQGNSYLGSFSVHQEGNMTYLINALDIDDYLLSVIRHEGWPGWSLEVNKVLAVACRTYLVWQVLQAQRSKRPYHIENGIRHQTYKGHHKYTRLKHAIDQTRDICIAYDGKPILAMFDACCGGVVPADIDNPDYKKYSYLTREDACNYCKGCKVANWKLEVVHDDMVSILQKDIPSLTSIDSMSVVEKDPAGLAKKVLIETSDAKIYIPGKRMYSLFPGVKSFTFDIDTYPKKHTALAVKGRKKLKKHAVKDMQIHHVHDTGEKKFVVYGRGYGHHVGLCQWGAMKLVQDHHWNYQKILQFYYPGTELIKLSYQR